MSNSNQQQLEQETFLEVPEMELTVHSNQHLVNEHSSKCGTKRKLYKLVKDLSQESAAHIV
jgi:hypothetical protein